MDKCVIKETKDAVSYLNKAEKMCEMGEGRFALNATRNSLECLVKNLCMRANILCDTREITLEAMINLLSEGGIINSTENDLMHRIRKISNKGDHVDLSCDEIPISEAYTAIQYLEELINLIERNIDIMDFKYASEIMNVPMEHPDYYSVDRRYFGKWAHCMSLNELLQIPEYCDLLSKTTSIFDKQNVEASLNIAIGFMSKKIDWNDNNLINVPPFIHRGKAYPQKYAYDYRYYYWIAHAINAASIYHHPGMPVGMSYSKKYIATALWEQQKMRFFYYVGCYYNNMIVDVDEIYNNTTGQYELFPIYADTLKMVEDMFSNTDFKGRYTTPSYFGIVARDYFEKYEDGSDCNIIADVHLDAKNHPWMKYNFMEYCIRTVFAEFNDDKNFENICPTIINDIAANDINKDYSFLESITGKHIEPVVVGQRYSWNVLEPYTVGTFCKKIYDYTKSNYPRLAKEYGAHVYKEKKNFLGLFKK